MTASTETFRDRVNNKRHQLKLQGKTLKSWAEENGYTLNQLHAVTRRRETPVCGLSREIAEKLGMMPTYTESSDSTNPQV